MKTTLYILGIGCGGTSYLTQETLKALQQCEVIVAYSKYARELETLLEGKTVLSSGMTYENERFEQAIQSATKGKTTAILSNGDANVFGIASQMLQHIQNQNLHEQIEIITLAGISSFLAVMAKVGAFSSDMALLNFSTKFNTLKNIKKRFEVCMINDFTIAIYNPKSKKKSVAYDSFLKTLEQFEQRVAIIASNVGRTKEKITISNTKTLIEQGINNPLIGMATLIIICKEDTLISPKGLVISD
jgi:precorrin-3B C17-methyltransferase